MPPHKFTRPIETDGADVETISTWNRVSKYKRLQTGRKPFRLWNREGFPKQTFDKNTENPIDFGTGAADTNLTPDATQVDL